MGQWAFEHDVFSDKLFTPEDRLLGFWIDFFGAYLDAVGDFVEMI